VDIFQLTVKYRKHAVSAMQKMDEWTEMLFGKWSCGAKGAKPSISWGLRSPIGMDTS